RLHSQGETTSSPISNSECAQRGSPPASTNSVWPLGETNRIESPWLTSIVVTSSAPAWTCGCTGPAQIQNALKANAANPTPANIALRLIKSIARARVDAAVTMTYVSGVGTGVWALHRRSGQCY